MTINSFDVADVRIEDQQTAATRYRLQVVASNTTDAVQSAGGWLADRALAGWDITVACIDGAELRALRILGVQASSFESTSKLIADEDPIPALAITGDAFAHDTDLRINVARVRLLGMTELTLWGSVRFAGIDHDMRHLQYRVSAAGRAFKGHALKAMGLSDKSVGAIEPFRTGRRGEPSMDSPYPQPLRLDPLRDQR